MRVDILEVEDARRPADDLVSAGREIDIRRRVENQRIVPRAAVEGDLGSVIGDRVVADAARDHVGPAAAIYRVAARAADDDIGARRADDADALSWPQRAGVDVLEIRDEGGIAEGLIGLAQVDVRGRVENQGVDAGPAVEGGFGSVVMNDVVAGPGADDVRAAAAVDAVVTRARRDRIRARGTRDGNRRREDGGVEALEVGDVDGIAGRLVGSRDGGEVDCGDAARGRENERVDAGTAVEGDFRAVIDDGVIAGPSRDDIGAAAAVDGVVPRAAGQDIRARRARQRNADHERGGVDILEVDDIRGSADDLIGVGEVDIRRRVQHQRVVPRPAVDGDLGAVIMNDVVARSRVDDVGAAAPIDGVVARTRRDDVRAVGPGDVEGAR